ncbi:MAG TPA: NifU family protein [Bacteroidales bacterium]|nr:NifU family protein [Bacteroidales bacterium]
MEETKKKEFETKIRETIEKVRPYLVADGGDIELKEITDDLTVKVELQGACGTCPFSLFTLKNGVEQALKKEVPEIKEVVATNQ